MSFQTVVVSIFSIILIIFLVIIGVTLYDNKYKNPSYPSKTSQCPDYWTLDSNNNCVNTNGLGKSVCQSKINITDKAWNGSNANCGKYNWAKACEVSWDGITNVGLNCEK